MARNPAARALRTEPDLSIPPAALAAWRHEPAKILYLRDADRHLDAAPSGDIDPVQAAVLPPARHRPNASIAASVLLHVAVALFFVQLSGDEVQIAGWDVPQVALLGNAPEDASAAGDSLDQPDTEITSVTILTMMDAEPVTAAEVTLSPVDVQPSLDAAAVEPIAPDEVETITPVEIAPALPVAAKPTPVAKVAQATPAVPSMAETADATEPVEPLPAPASLAPEVLTAERVEPADTADAVPIPSQSLAEPVDTVREVQQAPPERPVPVIESVTPTVQAVEETAVVQPSENAAVVAPVEDPSRPVKDRPLARKPTPPKPKPKPKPALEKPVPPKAKSTETKRGPRTDERKQKPAGSPAKSGSKGRAQADARRGQADGALDGRSTATGKAGARSSASGNAAVTNYPGKIVSKLRRALRYPAQAKSQNLRGEVQVSFTVSSGGAVGGVRVVRSSGSPLLDRAAVETVRRAAPFPPIPEGAGRSSWPFTVPLAFMR